MRQICYYFNPQSVCHESQGSTETRIHKTKDFNITQGAQARKALRKTIKDRQKQTEWTGAYKDRTIKLNDETHLDHMDTTRQRKLGHQEHMGSKTHTKQSTMLTLLFFSLAEKCNSSCADGKRCNIALQSALLLLNNAIL